MKKRFQTGILALGISFGLGIALLGCGSTTTTTENFSGSSEVQSVSATQLTLTVSVTEASPSQRITVSWDRIKKPQVGDWIGLYSAGATTYQQKKYLNCSSKTLPSTPIPSGSCPITLPKKVGEYEFRLFRANGQQLAVSPRVRVVGPSPSPLPGPSPTSRPSPSPTVSPTPIAGSPANLFQQPHPWTRSVAGLAKSSTSDAIIQWLTANGGWGTGKMRIDFSIEAFVSTSTTPFLAFTPTSDFFQPDCDRVPFPVPSGGSLEGEQSYACSGDGDCHLLVVDPAQKKLYEMWRANISGGTFYGGCAVVWDLTRAYPANLRGEGCTSADAAGLPITPLLFSADEVHSGVINHAIRFILPNSRIRNRTYVYPGTHATGAATGGSNAPPYGVRFRLRSNFPLNTLPSEGARVIARAMQTYGLFLADGGNIALTAQSDRFTRHKWSEVGVDSFSLQSIQMRDMEVVEMGSPIFWGGDCSRNP